MAFSDEVESIFTTKHLEKTPTAKVVKFVPNSEVDCNYLSPEEEQILQKTLHRLAERVRRSHMYIACDRMLPCFCIIILLYYVHVM